MWDTRTGSAFLELDRLLPEEHQSSQLRGHFPHADTPTNSIFVSGSRLKLASKLPADGDFTTIPLTTRIPPPGEHLTVVGFRFERSASADSIHNPVALSGLMTYRKAPLGNSVFRDMILLWRRVRRSKFSAAPLAE